MREPLLPVGPTAHLRVLLGCIFIANQHANLSRTIDGSIAQHLQKLRVEIKGSHQSLQDHMSNWRNCLADHPKRYWKARHRRCLGASYLVAELATDISTFKNTLPQVTAKTDP